jgi:tetratricopeptide (TPR) repeat protein
MRWCLNRWETRLCRVSLRTALFFVCCAAATHFLAVAQLAVAGPVDSTAAPAAKIKEIEDAGDMLLKGKVDEAYKLLQEAVKKKPDLPPARLMLARLLLNTKEGQQAARQALELAAAENPDHPQVFLTNGSLALAEGRVTDTILNCEKALALSAADRWTEEQRKEVRSKARGGLAAAYEGRRDWASARSQHASLLEAEPKNGQLRARLAQALFFLDKPDDALQELTQAAKLDPTTMDPPHVSMAKFWTTKGDTKLARESLDKAIKAEPNNVRVHLAYGDWLLQQNEIDQAKIHIEAALKIKADDVEVQKLQGLIARIQKDMATAEKIFRRISNDAPADFFATNHLALVLADQTDEVQRGRAVQLAEGNAARYQRSAEALATLGYVYFRANKVDDALKALEAAIKGAQGQMSPDTAYYLALCWNDKERYDDAKKVLKGALEAKGLFVYRKEAKELSDKLEKKTAAAPPKGPMSK